MVLIVVVSSKTRLTPHADGLRRPDIILVARTPADESSAYRTATSRQQRTESSITHARARKRRSTSSPWHLASPKVTCCPALYAGATFVRGTTTISPRRPPAGAGCESLNGDLRLSRRLPLCSFDKYLISPSFLSRIPWTTAHAWKYWRSWSLRLREWFASRLGCLVRFFVRFV